MNNVDACLDEIDRAVTQLGARGVQVFTNVAGKPLSAPEYRPIFQKMVAHDLPVWVHPMRGPQFSDMPARKFRKTRSGSASAGPMKPPRA